MATANELLANAKIAAAKITPANPRAKAKTAAKAKAKTAAKSNAKPTKKMNCPVCVNGRGEYANIAKHNKRHHGGKTPEVK